MQDNLLKEKLSEILEVEGEQNYHYNYLISLEESELKIKFLEHTSNLINNQKWDKDRVQDYYGISIENNDVCLINS
jgi:hypothetical protein